MATVEVLGSNVMESTSWADQMEKAEEVTVEGDIKTVVKQEDGKKKVITRFQIKTVPKVIAERRKWNKFGDAIEDGEGVNQSTTQTADEVYLSLTSNRESLEQQEDDPLKKLSAQHKMVTCRYCKGDHWSTKCPYKDSLAPTTERLDEITGQAGQSLASGSSSSLNGGGAASAGGKYVPPSLRAGAANKKGEAMTRSKTQEDQAAVRVTNLSEEATEGDLRELFGHFGAIQRVFLAKDKRTQQSKGFAFVHYYDKSDAQKAIDKLNGFGYDHLILKVEWAKPSTPR